MIITLMMKLVPLLGVKMKNVLAATFIILTILAIPLHSIAKDGYQGKITVNAEIVDLEDESFKYGEYDGLSDEGAHFFGDADISYDRENYFIKFEAKDLGLDKKNVSLENGRYGEYRLFLEYDELPQLISGNSSTIFFGAGSANLTLPAGFGSYSTTSLMPLGANLKDIDLKLIRKSGAVRYSRRLRENLDFTLSFEREKKEGIKSLGGTVGQFARLASAVIMPEPVDYGSDEFRASLNYSKKKLRAGLDYYFSRFENKNSSLSWENPFIEYGGSSYPANSRMSLPPDNRHSRLTVSGAIDLEKSTTLSFIAEQGEMKQNEALLPYSINGEITPRSSAEAKINTKHLAINITARPRKKLSIAAKFSLYAADNKTPVERFLRVNNDTGGQFATDSRADVYNLPLGYSKSNMSLDTSYRVATATTLKIGLDQDRIKRDYRAAAETKENIYSAALNSILSRGSTASVSYSYSARRAVEGYDQSRVYDSYHSAGYIATVNPGLRYDNMPALRQFDLAERDRTKYGANVTLPLSEESSVGLYYNNIRDNYNASVLGLTESEERNYTIDLTSYISKTLSLYSYYTGEKMNMRQAGASPATGDWMAEHRDRNSTAGIGLSIGFMRNDLTIDSDYSYSSSTSSINFPSSASVDLPDLKTNLSSLEIKGEYKVDKKMSVGLGYRYDKYSSDDWATNGFDPGSMSGINSYIMTLSGSVPDYEAHLGTLFITYNL